MTQENSFPCRECGEVFTEESGAYQSFTCENCINDIIDKSTGELEDNNCSHVFHTIREANEEYEDTYYYFCENCQQYSKEVFDKENKEVVEVEILREGLKN